MFTPGGGTHTVTQIQKDAKEDKKTGYTTFKNVVWHESAFQIFKEVIEASKFGYMFKCGDRIERILKFIILILSADYEEQ